MDSPETYISLYAGGGGLDMGFQRAHGNAECVAVVEHEASAAALLVDHIEAGLLDAAPVFTDAYTFPAERFHGLVDWVIGGPPCQPFSVAGKRLGADDARNLWPLTLRLVEQIQPRGCFFENVPSADSLWYVYEEVIPGLRYLGYEVEAGIFSAAEVGAPHNRERIFILAYSKSCERGRVGAETSTKPESKHHKCSRSMADTGCEHQHLQQWGAGAESQRENSELAYTGSKQRDSRRNTKEERIHSSVGQTESNNKQRADWFDRAGEGSAVLADTRQLPRQVPQTSKPDGTQRDVATRTSGELGDTDESRLQRESRPNTTDTNKRYRTEVDNTNNTGRRQSHKTNATSSSKQFDGADGGVADTDSARFQGGLHRRRNNSQRRQESAGQPTDSNQSMENTDSKRGCSWVGERQHAVHAFPPGPTGNWSNIPERLWPAVKPDFRDMADELAGRVAALSRAQELRILGNGVVPATAHKAFSTLMDTLCTQQLSAVSKRR